MEKKDIISIIVFFLIAYMFISIYNVLGKPKYYLIGKLKNPSVVCIDSESMGKLIETKSNSILYSLMHKGKCFINKSGHNGILTRTIPDIKKAYLQMYSFQNLDDVNVENVYVAMPSVTLTEIWQDVFDENRKKVFDCESDTICEKKLKELESN